MTSDAQNIVIRKFIELRRLYDQQADDLALWIARHKIDYPQGQIDKFIRVNKLLQKRLAEMTSEINAETLKITEDGIKSAWEQSNRANDLLVKNYVFAQNVSDTLMAAMMKHNLGAMEMFLNRSLNGLNLSERIWDYGKMNKLNFNLYMSTGIAEGKGAAELSREIRQCLKEPEKLFRRVRDADGNLVLSKAAKAYHPGRGMYRSSYKNALRMTRTETNIAYNLSDYYRIQELPFVEGIEIHLSDAHPALDVCDYMVGTYPKDYVFYGFHSQCLCYQTTILQDVKEFKRYLQDGFIDQRKQIRAIPTKAQNYIETNKSKIIKSDAYWKHNFTKDMKLRKNIPEPF